MAMGPAREQARREAIQALHLLDAPVSETVNEAIRLAAEVCDAPAAINVMDGDWQRSLGPFMAAVNPPPIPREGAICNQVIESGVEFIAADMRLEPALVDHPFVNGTVADLRFYVSIPLTTQAGTTVGTLCAFDQKVHDLTPIQRRILRALAAQITAIYELHSALTKVEEAAEQLAAEEAQAAEVLQTSSDAYLAWRPDGVVFGWNRAAEQLYGYPADDAIGRDLADLIVLETDQPAFRRTLAAGPAAAAAQAASTGRTEQGTLRVGQRRADGSRLTVDLTIWPSRASTGWHAFARDVTEIEQSNRARVAAEERWRVAFENAPVGMLVNDLTDPANPVLISANNRFCEMLGRTEAEIREVGVLAVMPAEDVPGVHAGVQAMLAGELPLLQLEKRYLHASGSVVWGRLTAALARGADGTTYAISQVEDITVARGLERARQRAEGLLATAFEHAPNGTAIIGIRGEQHRRLLRVNPALIAMIGQEDLMSTDLGALLEHGGADQLLADFERLAAGEIDHFEQTCHLRAGGGYIVAQAFVALTRDADGRPEHALAQLRDITAQQAHEDWLVRRAKTDPLTGLANRLAVRERLVEEIAALRAGEGALAVMLLDLDGFKAVNDTLGHQAGDDLLCGVADAVVAVLPREALAARLGGDEFLLLAPHQTPDTAAALTERITAAVAAVGAQLSGRSGQPVTGSVGLTLTVNPAVGPNELIQAADLAMYDVKRTRSA